MNYNMMLWTEAMINRSGCQSWFQIQAPTLVVWFWHVKEFIWCEVVKFLRYPTIRLADKVVIWSQCSAVLPLMILTSHSLIQPHCRNTIFIWVISAALDIITVKPKLSVKNNIGSDYYSSSLCQFMNFNQTEGQYTYKWKR